MCKLKNSRRRTRAVLRGGPSPRKRLFSLGTVPGLVTRDRYIIRRIGPHPYLYLRQYQGAAEHARPVYADLYLGAAPERLLRPSRAEELRRWAQRKRRVMVRKLGSP